MTTQFAGLPSEVPGFVARPTADTPAHEHSADHDAANNDAAMVQL